MKTHFEQFLFSERTTTFLTFFVLYLCEKCVLTSCWVRFLWAVFTVGQLNADFRHIIGVMWWVCLSVYVLLCAHVPLRNCSPTQLSVCLSVGLSALEQVSGTARLNFTKLFCACCLCPWPGLPQATLHHVVYVRFCGCRHVFRSSHEMT